MELLMLGLNHKTAPVDVRERFSIPKAAVKSGLANLGEYEGILEAVVLSTCNRSEMYAVVDDAERDLATLKQFLFDLTGNEENIDEYLYHYADEECIEHLFSISVLIIARKGENVKRRVKINVFCIKCGIFNGQFVHFTC